MLTLLEQQQKLLEILRGRRADAGITESLPVDVTIASDPWLASVVRSPGLQILRQTASWWQRFQIESTCRYTSRLMKRLGCFESYLESHIAGRTAPPAIEELTAQFLTSLAEHDHPLVRAVAQLELFCMGSADAPARSATIDWDRNPEAVMVALDRGRPLPEAEPGVRYRMRLKSSEPVTCMREPLPDE
jgi:hypothetical protein